MLFRIMSQIQTTHGCMQYDHKIFQYENGKSKEVKLDTLDSVISKELSKRVKKYYNYTELPNNLNVLYNMLRYPFCISFNEVKSSYTLFKNVEISKVENKYMFIEKNNYLDIFKMLYKIGINPEKRLTSLDFKCIIKDLIVSKFKGIIESEYIDLREEENIYNLYLNFDDEIEINIKNFEDLKITELNLDTDVYLFPVRKNNSFLKDKKLKFDICKESEEYIYILKNDIYEDEEYRGEEILKQALYITDKELAEYTKVFEDYDISIYYVEK